MQIKFLGATRQVTGSSYLLETDAGSIMVDCGMFQGADHLRSQRRLDWTFNLSQVRYLLLTHAHLDHCGLIPRLVALGYKGQIICTPATRDLAEVVLRDSAGIQEEDAAFDLKRWRKSGRVGAPPEPLYTSEDVELALTRFETVAYGERRELRSAVTVRFVDAGHIPGAASVEVQSDGAGPVTLAFSGDIGYPGRPILEDPVEPLRADFIVMEGTYGDRLHEPLAKTHERFGQIIERARRHGGAVIIPTFAIGRAQELLYLLNKLRQDGRLQGMPVFVDSPMADEATEVLIRHPECFDQELRDLIRAGQRPFDFPGLQNLTTGDQSRTLNDLQGPFIVLAGSGMCTGGRIRHHLVHHLERPQDTILFVGFQAKGTLGRRIEDGEKQVQVLNKRVTVRATVETLEGFSAHADKEQLLTWLAGCGPSVRRVFLTHGEPTALAALAASIRARLKLPVLIPEMGDAVDLEDEAAAEALARHRARDLPAPEAAPIG